MDLSEERPLKLRLTVVLGTIRLYIFWAMPDVSNNLSRKMTRWFVWHPYLFAWFPILYLHARNTHQVSPGEVFWPLVIVSLGVALATCLVSLLFRNAHKSALVVSSVVLLFFSWSRLLNLGALILRVDPNNHLGAIRNWSLLSVSILALLFVSVIIFRSRSSLLKLTTIANRTGLILILLQVGGTGWTMISNSPVEEIPPNPIVLPEVETELPNIYYIIVDGYARSDVLKELFDYDNTPLLTSLRRHGFYVAENSRANYCQTLLSLSSSMNMGMMTRLTALAYQSENRTGITQLLSDNLLCRHLRSAGYRLAAFRSVYSLLKLNEVTDYELPGPRGLSEYQSALIASTPLRFFASSFTSRFDQSRDNILHTLRALAEIENLREPYFVMAHILCPHPPFLWDEDGHEFEPQRPYNMGDGSDFYAQGTTRSEYRDGYRNQIRVLDSLLSKTINGILDSQKDSPPVIILQSDHGSGMGLDWASLEKTDIRERFSILNAYYFPGGDTVGLYPSISPVNTFRVVLNKFVGFDYPMAPDRSFFSEWDRPFDFIDVTDRLDSLESRR